MAKYLAVASRVGAQAQARDVVQEVGLASAAPAKGPRSTQVELLAAGERAESRGRNAEAAALFTAAVDERPDILTTRRLEAHYVARGAWRELAEFYRRQAERAERAERGRDRGIEAGFGLPCPRIRRVGILYTLRGRLVQTQQFPGRHNLAWYLHTFAGVGCPTPGSAAPSPREGP